MARIIGSELHVEFVDLFRLVFRGGDPFEHLRHREQAIAIPLTDRIQRHPVGAEGPSRAGAYIASANVRFPNRNGPP